MIFFVQLKLSLGQIVRLGFVPSLFLKEKFGRQMAKVFMDWMPIVSTNQQLISTEKHSK